MTKVKICGLMKIDDALSANVSMPDYVGFVLTKGFKRSIDMEQAAEIRAALSDDIKTVGVFVDEDIEYIAKLASKKIISYAQLHGNEDEDYIKKLREKADLPVIKAFKVSTSDDVMTACRSGAEYILLDSGCGSGKRFDWNLLSGIHREYFLAGGLDCDNVRTAIECTGCAVVDVSSGVESEGRKDPVKMKKFVEIVRNC